MNAYLVNNLSYINLIIILLFIYNVGYHNNLIFIILINPFFNIIGIVLYLYCVYIVILFIYLSIN